MEASALEALPFAVGILLSPFPVVPVILLLLSPRARVVGPVFWLTFVAGVALITAVFALLSELIDFPDHPPSWASWTRIILGVLLVALAVRQWLAKSEGKEAPVWLESLQQAGPGVAARYGFLLSAANPKVLVLAAGGGLVIGAVPGGVGAMVGMIIAFAVISGLVVAIPVVLYLVLGERMLPPLRSAESWLSRHNSAITAVVIGVIGLIVGVAGVQALTGA